jgi:hypothetical protein
MNGACSTHVRNDKSIQKFGREPEGKRSFARLIRRLEYDITMYLR